MVQGSSRQTRIYADTETSGHDPGPPDPERPARIEACMTALEKSSIDFEIFGPSAAAREDLERVHRANYIDWLEKTAASGGARVDPETVVGVGSFEVARRAAGTCCQAAEVAAFEGIRSLCLVRPPGHHATSDRAMGFCLINNVAVAAARLLSRGIERIMIFDFDVHHGNGTQDIFWRDSRVLYVSVHQWPWYPWRSGSLEEVGEGEGTGLTINVPLPAMTGDSVYLAALERIVLPPARKFRPEVLLVSAGFDAHRDDPLSLMEVTTEGFRLMVGMLAHASDEVCQGKMTLVLEGGYNLAALGESVSAVAEALGSGVGPRDTSALSHGLPFSSPALDRIEAFHRARGIIP